MILTCPTCATRYFVGDDAVPASGRTVRCAACGGSWRALPLSAEPTPLELTPAPTPTAAAGAAPVSKAFRAQVQERRRTRRAAAAGGVWAAAGVSAAVLAAGLALFREQVVEAVPRTAGVYAALGRPVNPTGLALEAQGQPGLANGRSVTVVSGTERNVAARPRPPQPVRVTFLDKAGRPLTAQVAQVAAGAIAPGEVRPFRAVFVDPPLAASSYQVEFAFDAARPRRPDALRRAPPPAATPMASAQAAPGPAPAEVREARPLPPGSPYALPAVAAAPHG